MAVTPIINSQLTDIEQAIKDQTTAIENLVAVPVEDAVNDWLTAHPEATTTVENGSVTGLKLYPVGNGTDLQNQRQDASQSANAQYSFIAGGGYNAINDYTEMGKKAFYSHAEGYSNRAHDWYGHAEGSGCIVDSKIGHVEGNGTICSTNDGHAEGNRTVAGRRYFESGVTTGAEDAGDSLGVLNYVLIPDSEGDVTSFFPNALIDNVTTRYGAGTQKDSVGNIYPSGMTPAVWDGDTLVTENSLMWAMHRICILRGSAENDIDYVTIAKCTYTSGVGTKVYYYGDNPTTNTKGIYTSYCPVLLGGGNGAHSEGYFTSAWGYGAHSEGYYSRAWHNGAHAEGRNAQALGEYSHAEGYFADANGAYSHAEGQEADANGQASHAEGRRTVASGLYSHAEGNTSVASGESSHAEGDGNTASGKASHAEGLGCVASANYAYAGGYESKATRRSQRAFADGKISEVGDKQVCEIVSSVEKSEVGWHNVTLFENAEAGKTYLLDIDVLGIQTAGTAGTVGDTFGYKIKAILAVASNGTGAIVGTPIRELVGRSSGMSGDGLASGARVSLYNGVYPAGSSIALRYDGVADTTFRIFCHTKWLEMKI